MSESSQTSQADLCHVKRLFFPSKQGDLSKGRLCQKTWQIGWIWIHAEFGYMRYGHSMCYMAKKLLRFFQHHSGAQREEGGGGVGWLSCLFVKSFLHAFRKKKYRNIFSHNTGRLAKFGWILTYLKISLEIAVTWLLPGAIQLISCHSILWKISNFWPTQVISNHVVVYRQMNVAFWLAERLLHGLLVMV